MWNVVISNLWSVTRHTHWAHTGIISFCFFTMTERKERRMLSESISKKIIAEHGEDKGYSTISKYLMLLWSQLLILGLTFKANLPGCGCEKKIDATF